MDMGFNSLIGASSLNKQRLAFCYIVNEFILVFAVWIFAFI